MGSLENPFFRKGRASQIKKHCIGGSAYKVGLGQLTDLREEVLAKESYALYVDYSLSPN